MNWTIPTPDLIEEWKAQGQVRKLIRVLAQPDSPHHLLTLRALEELGEEAMPALVQVVEIVPDNLDLLCYAIDLLALMRYKQAVASIVALTEKGVGWFESMVGGEKLWVTSVDALGKIGTIDGLNRLRDVAQDNRFSERYRQRAIEALSMSRQKESVERLADLLSSLSSDELKTAALAGLIGNGEPAKLYITNFYNKHKAPVWRKRIVRLMGEYQAQAFVKNLLEWMEQAEGDLLIAILVALGEIGNKRAFAPIKLCFDKLDQTAKVAASRALVNLGWLAGEQDSEESRLYYFIGSGDLHAAISMGPLGLDLVCTYLELHPDALSTFCRSGVSETDWWFVMDALSKRKQAGITKAFKAMLEYDDYSTDVTTWVGRFAKRQGLRIKEA